MTDVSLCCHQLRRSAAHPRCATVAIQAGDESLAPQPELVETVAGHDVRGAKWITRESLAIARRWLESSQTVVKLAAHDNYLQTPQAVSSHPMGRMSDDLCSYNHDGKLPGPTSAQ